MTLIICPLWCSLTVTVYLQMWTNIAYFFRAPVLQSTFQPLITHHVKQIKYKEVKTDFREDSLDLNSGSKNSKSGQFLIFFCSQK